MFLSICYILIEPIYRLTPDLTLRSEYEKDEGGTTDRRIKDNCYTQFLFRLYQYIQTQFLFRLYQYIQVD